MKVRTCADVISWSEGDIKAAAVQILRAAAIAKFERPRPLYLSLLTMRFGPLKSMLTRVRRKIVKKIQVGRAPCACVQIVAEYLPVLDVAMIVCGYLEKMTDKEVLHMNVPAFPGITESLTNRKPRFRSRFPKRYENPFTRNIQAPVRIFSWFNSVHICDNMNSTYVAHGIAIGWIHKLENDMFSETMWYDPGVFMKEFICQPRLTAKYHGLKYALQEYAANIRMQWRILDIILGCPYRHVLE